MVSTYDNSSIKKSVARKIVACVAGGSCVVVE